MQTDWPNPPTLLHNRRVRFWARPVWLVMKLDYSAAAVTPTGSAWAVLPNAM